MTFQNLRGVYKKAEEGLLTRVCSDKTRDNGIKLKKSRLKLDIRKQIFIVSIVRYWNRLSREAVNALTLEMFKAKLNGTLSNLG